MQRYFCKEKNDNGFILNDSDIHHIINVMRMKDNEKIEVVYNHEVFLCSIEISNNNVFTKIIESKKNMQENKPFVSLVLPLLKEQKLDLIFQKATELGVDEIFLTSFERSIIKLDDNKLSVKIIRWEKILKEASEQSMRIDIPRISYVAFNELKNLDGTKLICSTSENNINIKNVLKKHHCCDKLVVAIGPEGGFSNTEENKMSNYGFIKTSLGNQILRVETVPMFILSVIRYEYMEW